MEDRGMSKAPVIGSKKTSTVKGTPVAQLGDGFVLVRVNAGKPSATLRASDSAKALVGKAAKALRKPGLPKSSVFTGSGRIFAYSVDPTDPDKLIRETPDGKRQSGRLVNGRFLVKA